MADKRLMFGKLPAKVDKRTIRLSSILVKKLLPDLPESYDIDKELGGIVDNNMYANDQYGDCVMAARAHQTLRFEKFEQNKLLSITDKEVINEYLEESGGLDVGLYLLNSLKAWRKNGWMVGSKTYCIYAFASVDWKNHDEVKYCIHLLGGVNFGVKIYQADIDQFESGEGWHLTGKDGSFLGGHGVYAFCWFDVVGYDDNGLICMTWGKRQHIKWDWWDARVDESYGIVDNRDDWVENSPVDVKKLDAYLDEITGDGDNESTCQFSRGIVKGLNGLYRVCGKKTRFVTTIRKEQK